MSGVLGPEGPLFVDGNLYFVAWTSGTLSKWDGKNTTVLNSQPGCSHNGLALTKQKTFLLACADEHGAILELDIKDKQLRRWDADDKGSKFDGGINDIVVTEAMEVTEQGRELARQVRAQLQSLTDFKRACAGQPIEFRIASGNSVAEWLLVPKMGKLATEAPSARRVPLHVIRYLPSDRSRSCRHPIPRSRGSISGC